MEKREKIIVIMVVVAALYGAIDFTLTSQKKKGKAAPSAESTPTAVVTPAELASLISADNKKIAQIAASLNEPWKEHIFTSGPIDYDGEKKIDASREALLNELKAKVGQLFYSGFVSTNDDRIAIINGIDYRVGEQIEGFTVTKITIDAVQVSAHDASFDIPATAVLPPPAGSGHMPSKPE